MIQFLGLVMKHISGARNDATFFGLEPFQTMELAIGFIIKEIFSSYSNIILSTICFETKNSWLGRLVSSVINIQKPQLQDPDCPKQEIPM